MRNLPILVIFFALSILASADIRTYNEYYTSGAAVINDVFLHDIDYINCVDVYSDSISLSGLGENSSGSNDAELREFALVHGKGGPLGSNLEMSAEKIQYAKGIAAGSGLKDDINEIKYSYLLSTGKEYAHFFNRYTTVDESLTSEQNTYSAIFDVTPMSVSLEGYGNRFSFDDKDSSFVYNLNVVQRNLWANTNAWLTAKRVNDVDVTPSIYAWNVSVGSAGAGYARSHFDMALVAGDRQLEGRIIGTNSNGLVAYVPYTGTPWHVDPIPDGSGSDDVKTIEDLINLIRQGVSNYGFMDSELTPI
ncbi:MAG: hypothetical protein A4E44_01866 [Methanosaeta sp. PtaB.Bin018]|nr:MAG: hypothetical protein A4E44_01866 [Methanosaeta sp. PtaB.Bin018]